MGEIERSLHKAISILYNDAAAQQAAAPNSISSDSLLYQSAFYSLTRILLFRVWRNAGLITFYSQDEARHVSYEEMEREISRVLQNPTEIGTERGWPSESHRRFNWYRPGSNALKEAVKHISDLNTGDMTADVLGNTYESSLDPTGRRRSGQYYTPPEVIGFIWDRVGLKNPSDFFRSDSGHAHPKLIFDPAAGSGGFLQEAARRLVTGLEKADSFEQLAAVRRALGALHGSEIEAFPHYLAGINMLIQITPLIKSLGETGFSVQKGLMPVLLNTDALSLHERPGGPGMTPGNIVEDRNDFDYICSNPPFIREKGNKELFRQTLSRHPYWKQYYQGKMDYMYWFIILGLSKLRDGGQLGFITSSYWPTADGARKLRRYILSNAIIREIIDLGDLSVFGDARGQHNMVFILVKCADESKRKQNRIKLASFQSRVSGRTGLKDLLSHLSTCIDNRAHSDELVEVYSSSTVQGELDENAWNLAGKAIAPGLTGRNSPKTTPLGQICNVSQGIISGADRVTPRNIKLMPDRLIEKHGIRIGDGIFVLSQDELESLGLNDRERRIIKPLMKNSDIRRYYVNRRSPLFLIYTTRETDIEEFPSIKAHLEKFRPLLESKRECREGKLPWFSLHWPRDQRIFEGEKIVTPNRAVENTFALSKSSLYGMSDIFFITSNCQEEDPGYVLAILNSQVMNQWFWSN
ncbi:MAG: N-6 DNA methylase, partial [Dehalococcoidia bacterium]